jgi:hypothetical protein
MALDDAELTANALILIVAAGLPPAAASGKALLLKLGTIELSITMLPIGSGKLGFGMLSCCET